jgi:ATP-binding cassette subfamily F protein 3
MPLAQLTNIEKILGDRMIFERLSFAIERGERVGLIGDNGAGKTTLFRTLTGELKPDSGDVSLARGATVGMLEQDPSFTPGQTLIDEAETAFAELHDLAHQMREVEHAMEHDHSDKILKKYEILQHRFEESGGYAWRHRLEAVLDGVGLARSDWEKPVESLSGGQRSRLALARLLVAQPDLLLLDEPTNHLDIAATEWLETWLLGFSGAVLVISHDRYLLDRVATRIAWLTRKQISTYPGNYTAFETQREVEVLSQQRAYEQQRAMIDKQSEYIRRFGAGQRARQAAGLNKRLDRFLRSDSVVSAVESGRAMNLRISTDQRAGDRLIRVKELSKSFDGKRVWNDIQFELKRGERVGIIGPNGVGKTTLLRTLTGDLDADSGEVQWGANITIGYYDQKLDDFDPDLSVIDEVLAETEGYTDEQLRDALGAMMFSGDDVEKPMRLLSGGERARVALTKLLLNRPNVLLLDEPTNHLDIASVDALERTLDKFEGSILCVSHDRHFLDRVAKRLLVIEPDRFTDFTGNWSAWHEKELERARAKTEKPRAAPKPAEKPKPIEKPKARNKDNPYARPFGTLSLEQLERKISDTETELGEVQAELADPGVLRDASKAKSIQSRIDRLSSTLKGLEEEYFSRQP